MCSENERPDRLIRMLYDIADDAEAPANSRLSAIKEILAAAHAAKNHAGAGALACTGGFAAVSAVHCKVQGE